MHETKKGRWIRHGNLNEKTVEYECSECGRATLWRKGMEGIYPSDECPYCKADMVSRRTACCDLR